MLYTRSPRPLGAVSSDRLLRAVLAKEDVQELMIFRVAVRLRMRRKARDSATIGTSRPDYGRLFKEKFPKILRSSLGPIRAFRFALQLDAKKTALFGPFDRKAFHQSLDRERHGLFPSRIRSRMSAREESLASHSDIAVRHTLGRNNAFERFFEQHKLDTRRPTVYGENVRQSGQHGSYDFRCFTAWQSPLSSGQDLPELFRLAHIVR
jgi:hypothetical protein